MKRASYIRLWVWDMYSRKTFKRFAALGLRGQLVLMCVGVFGAFFSLFCASVFIYIGKTYQRQFDSALYNYAVDVSHSIDFSSLPPNSLPVSVLADSEMILPFSIGETFLQIVDLKSRVMLKSKSLGENELPHLMLTGEHLSQEKAHFQDTVLPFLSASESQGRYRMVSHLARPHGHEPFVVQAAVPNLLLDHQKDALLTFFSISVPLMLLLSVFFGLEFSARAMAPVSAIIAKANEIEAKHLSEKIPVPNSRDEIQELAITLNGLLRRLERAFRLQEDFIADASHQLKTPLAILKGELDIFRKGEKSLPEVEKFAESAAQEVSYLSKIVEDLLTLARMDAESGSLRLVPLQLDEKLLEVVARFERASQARGIRFVVQLGGNGEDPTSDSFKLNAEPELLRAMLENLLENAVKYSPDGGVIWLTLFENPQWLELRVEDRGPGIAMSNPERLFERFFRAESTQDSISGTGLGLSIVKRIADLHCAKLDVRNRPEGGAAFSVSFPKPSDEIKNI